MSGYVACLLFGAFAGALAAHAAHIAAAVGRADDMAAARQDGYDDGWHDAHANHAAPYQLHNHR